MTTVAIYTRLSDTDAPSEQTATHRQEVACVSLAALRGWEVVRVFEDVDFSAYTRGLRRPAYEEMLDAIRAKRFDGVVAWKLDRFVRRSAEFERLWEACDHGGVFLTSVTEPIDTSTDLGLALVRVLVAFASLESATMGVRLTAKMRERADLGLPHSGQAAYGHKRGWRELEPEQAERVREAAERILAGEPLRSIVLDWNDRRVPTMSGTAKWQLTTLREILLSPRLAGLRRYKGEIIGVGDWPPILDEDRWRALCEIFEQRRREKAVVKERHVLTGRVRCGLCGQRMYLFPDLRSGGTRFMCPSPPKGCARINSREGHLTRLVLDELFERLARKRFGAIDGQEWLGLHEGAVNAAVDDYASSLRRIAQAYFVRGEMTAGQFLEAREGMFAEVERRLAADTRRPKSLRTVWNLARLRRYWPTFDLEEQRRLVTGEIAFVTVNPATRQGRYFDDKRFDITWRDDLLAQQRATAWVSTAETLKLVGCSRSRLRRLVEEDRLHPEPLGRAWMFSRHEVDNVASSESARLALERPPARRPGNSKPYRGQRKPSAGTPM